MSRQQCPNVPAPQTKLKYRDTQSTPHVPRYSNLQKPQREGRIMTGFRVGVVDPIIAARPAADTFTRANYLSAVASRVDSFWVPDHLNQLFPRSLWKQKYCGATKLIPKIDAAHGAVDHARAHRRPQPDRPPAPRRGGDRHAVDAIRPSPRRRPRRCTCSPAGGRSWVSAPANAKETSPTASTGPNRSRGLRRRWPPSARSGIRVANSSTGTHPISRCATRYSICRPIAASGPRSGSVRTVRACCAPRGVTRTPTFPRFPHRPVDYKQRLDVGSVGRFRRRSRSACPSSRRSDVRRHGSHPR